MASLLFYRGSSKQKKEEESNSLNIESLWCESSHSDLFLCRHSTRKRASLCQEPNGLEATLMIKLIIPYSTQNDDSSWLSTNAEMLIKYYSQIVHSYPSVTFDACELIMAFCLRGQSSINWRKLIFFVHKCPINHQFRILITYRKRYIFPWWSRFLFCFCSFRWFLFFLWYYEGQKHVIIQGNCWVDQHQRLR